MTAHNTCICGRMGAAAQTSQCLCLPLLHFLSPCYLVSPSPVSLSFCCSPFCMNMCLGPAGEALSVNSGARTSPWGPDSWIPTLWEPLFHFTPLSLLECLSSEVRNTCTRRHVRTHTAHTSSAHTFSHFLCFTHMHTCLHIHRTLHTSRVSHAVMKSQCFVCEPSHPGLTSWEPFSSISPCQALPLIKDRWVQ